MDVDEGGVAVGTAGHSDASRVCPQLRLDPLHETGRVKHVATLSFTHQFTARVVFHANCTCRLRLLHLLQILKDAFRGQVVYFHKSRFSLVKIHKFFSVWAAHLTPNFSSKSGHFEQLLLLEFFVLQNLNSLIPLFEVEKSDENPRQNTKNGYGGN